MLVTNELLHRSSMCFTNFRAFLQARYIALLSAMLSLAAVVPTLAQVSGQNVNMVSGTNWTNGDPFLQRQNEPSIAVSSRNPSHLLAGANDYRTVDLPGLLGIDERGDAWLGLFKSFDGGRRWQSTLLPGFPLDGSSEGLASPIHGFQAASDPTVRAGTNGLFYYTGIAYNRGTKPLSAVFIARFIDLNNKENGSATVENGSITNLAPRDTVKYVDTQIIGRGTPDVFLDKPWLAVDIPRGDSTCTISVNQDGKTITQKIPAGPVYVTATAFVGSGAKQFSVILFRRSLDCGVTWSDPVILSQNDEIPGDAEHQGTVIAIDPSVPSSQPAKLYVAWRRFANLNDPDDAPAIFVARSTDGGRHWEEPVPIVLFPKTCVKNPLATGCPYDQDFTTTSFRSNGYPAMTVDGHGKVYIAWSQRDANGDGKIMMGVSPNGKYFPAGSVAQVDVGPVADDNGASFSNLSGRGSQLMPSLGFAADRLTLVYYDLRQDHTTGVYVSSPDPLCDPLLILPCPLGAQYSEKRTLEGELAAPNASNNPAVFSPNIADSNPPLTIRRHTIDIMGAQADPLASTFQVPSFKTFRVSHYEFGSVPALFPDVEQLQYNVPNLPLFVDGTAPFMGDYIDVTGTPQIVPDGDGDWIFNVADSGTAVFHTAWTDNRDVIPPADGNWQHYTPPISASNPGSQPSKFDPASTPPACVVGQTGMRNQNVYTAEISSGVILTSPQTSKPVLTPAGQPIQREFVVELRNATNAARSFLVTIPTQPPGATASFQQFSSQISQTVKVNAFSSQSFAVFVVANAGSTVAFPSVLIDAAENDGAAIPLRGSILLNPDPTNPALVNPDNATVGANQISLNEFYNPGVANPGVANPGVANPGVANPGVANPGVANPGVANPQVITALNPGVANPGVANPGVANPGVANPGVANQAVTDVSYTITNEGNTSASYTVQFFQSGALPAAQFQIILSKLYFTQQAVGCQVQQVPTNVIVASITNPVFVTNPNQLGNPGVANLDLQTPTLNLAPGDSGQITLRTNLSVAQVQSLVLPNLSPVAVSQGVNTVDVKQGIFTPPISLIVTSTSASLPVGVVSQPFNTSLTSVGGNTGLHNWTITSGSLPPGLQLDAASGAITGPPTLAGSFPFTAQVTDTGAPQHTATRALTITIVPPVAITTPSPALVNGFIGSPYIQTFSAAGGLPTYTWSSTGTLPPGLTLSSSGTLSGVTTTPGTYAFTVKATDSIGLFATASYTIVVANQPAQIAFVVQPSNAVGSQAISRAVQVQVSDATGAVIPGVQVAMNFGTQACPAAVLSGSPLAITNASGIATFSNLIIDRGQNNFTLAATAGNATVVSTPFAVSGFCATASLSTPREIHTEVLLTTGKVLIAGGVNNTGALNTAELYDPATGTVSPTGNLTASNGRVWHASVLLPNGQVLVVGGSDNAGNPLQTAELYDPASGAFSATGSMAQARDRVTAVLLANGKVLVSGGVNSSGHLNSAEIYDPASGLFTPTGNLNQARGRHTMTLLPNGTVLVAGGRTFSGLPITVLASAEIFDPTANSGVGAFTSIGNMNSPRDELRATPLPNGTVLLTGGFVSYQTNLSASSAEIFDPATNAFTLTGSMSVPRTHQTTSLLADGSVLVAGGVPDTGATTPASPTADIFNPSTGTFAATGLMTTQREYARAVVLSNGNLLISGGDDGINTAANEEIYYSTAPRTPVAITTTALVPSATGKPYTQILLEQGGVGNLTWSVTGSLPAGISFSNQGILNGTPTVAGSFPLTFTLTDSSNPAKTASSNLTLTVTNSPLVFTSTTVPTAVAGRPYTQALPVVGGTQPYNGTVTSGTLPPGLALVGGVLLGSPSGAGNFTFTVSVTDSSTPTKSATQTLTMAVNTLVIPTTALPNGIVGVPYNAAITTVGGTLPLSFSLANTAFPPGLLIQQPAPTSSTGALAGTPTLAGTYSFSESVIDNSNPQQTATQNYVVTIAPAGTAVPRNVKFVSEPKNSVGGQTLAGSPIVVRVTDATNTPIAGTTVVMSFNGVPACSVAALGGTLRAVTDGTGQASFSNLSIDRGQLGYTLLASTGNVSAVSQPFAVNGFCPTAKALSTPRALHSAVTLPNGSVLIAGGANAFALPTNSAELYSPVTNAFTSAGVMNSARWAGTGTLLNDGTVLLTGGVNSPSSTASSVTNSAEIYNPSAGTFVATAGAMNSPRYSHTATLLADGRVLIVGGGTSLPAGCLCPGANTYASTAEIYNPITRMFTPTANNPITARQFHTATLLPNGQVLIAGGSNGNAILPSAEIFDPVSNAFHPTATMNSAHDFHAAALLPTGKVLIAGGFSVSTANRFVSTQQTEIYDPATSTFAVSGSLLSPRAEFSAAVLPDGTVLLPAGLNDAPVFVNSAETYNSSSGTSTATGRLSSASVLYALAPLQDGTVLITAGDGLSGVGTDAEVYYSTAPLAPLQVTTPSPLPAASLSLPYTQLLLEQGGVGTLTWTVTGGSLPPGITLSSAGVLNGTPTATGSFLFTAQVTDGSAPAKTTGSAFNLTVNGPIGLTVTTKDLPNGNIGISYFQILSAAGGTQPYTWGVIAGSLPTGLNLSNTGQISGTPTGSGTFNCVVQVTDSAGTTVFQSFTITTNAPLAITTASLPGSAPGLAYNQALSATGGAGSNVWSFVSGTLPPGITLSNLGILSGTPTTTGSFTFAVNVTDLIGKSVSATYTVNITAPLSATAHILFIIQPGQSNTGQNGLQGLVQLFDSNNAPIAGVELAASFGAKGCPDAALTGTLTAITDANGLAAFSGISSTRGGQAYTAMVSATSNPNVSATSNQFSIAGFCPTGNLTTLRREDTVALLPNGKVLIVGGLNSNGVPTVALSSAEIYDPTIRLSTPTGSMTTVRDLATASVLPNGKVLIVGGYDATGTVLASAELYDPNTGIFSTTGSMSFPRQEHTATLLPNGKVLIVGGVNWTPPAMFFASAELYDPQTGQFSLTGVMNSPHVSHTATLLPNGKVLVTGGLGSPAVNGLQLTTVAELYDPSTGLFSPTGSMAIARENHAASLLANGKVLVTGGYSTADTRTATATAEIYDPSAGTFSLTSSMSVARAEQTSTALPNGDVLIGGGFSSLGFFGGTQLSTAEVYNPSTGSFKGPANMAFAHSRVVAPLLPNGAVLLASGSTAELFFPTDPPFLVQEFTTSGNLNTARYLHTETLLSNGLVLIAGGYNGSSLSSAELHNPATGTFTATGGLNDARASHTATLLPNGTVLIAGGLGSSGVTTNAELYNPATGTFTATGGLNTARYQHKATLLPNGTVLIAGGLDSLSVPLASAELYDPATGTFTATGGLNSARQYPTATLLNNGLVLIAGGTLGGALASAELYDPATGTFAATGSLNAARDFHTATLLPTGKVLLAGGSGNTGVQGTSELYDPATRAFTSVGSLNTSRSNHTATLLNNGLVLIAGGSDSSFNPLAGAELYDPTTRTFTATGNLNIAREVHTATLLPTGKVLLAGGQGNTGPQATSELYQFGAIQQLQPQSCTYEGHIKSITGATPTTVRFVNASITTTFRVFWLDYNGNRVLYATLSPGQSFVQQTFLTHPWVIADNSPAATCQQIYLPLQEQAPAIFPPAQ